jgi:uncharacterized delta-60 repeat protein
MSIRRVAISLGLVFLAAVLIGVTFRSQLSSQGTGQSPTIIAGRNVNMVSGTTLPGGDPWLQRQNEPSIAVSSRNPQHLLAGCNDYRTVDMPTDIGGLPGKVPGAAAGDAWLGVFTSYDGGESWTSTLLPGYPQDPNPNNPFQLAGYTAAADPVVRSGPNGLFYYSGIAFNRKNNLGVVFVARFIDNNDTEGGGSIQYIDTKIIAIGTLANFLDKPWIAVDQPRLPAGGITVVGQSIPRHNVYIAYSAFTGSGASMVGDIMFARSTDCGTTWGSPIKLSSGSYAHQGATIAIKPVLGEVLVAFRRFARPSSRTPDSIFVAQSFTRGLGFASPVKVADITPFDQPTTDPSQSLPGTLPGPAFRTNSYPTMAVDASGHVYLAWSQRNMGPAGGARIVVSASYLGSSWSTPQLVSTAAENASLLGHQIMPSFSFAGGKLMLVWYDQRHDVSGQEYGYNNWILDDRPYRHTMDVRAAVAETKTFPTLTWKSTQVSRYLYAALKGGDGNFITDSNGHPIPFPVQFNCVNYTLFNGGLNAFMGDYIDVAASPTFRIDTWRNWYINATSSDSPVFHVAWTDNRDVRPPLNGNWAAYTPASSTQDSSFITPGRSECQGGGNAPGMRNQNIYTARVTWGIEAGSPTNTKTLNQSTARAFVVFVKNKTNILRHFKLTIASQPVGGQASFLQFGLLTSLNVDIAPYSTISRPVFISSTDSTAPVTINVDETDASGTVLTGGLKSSILINGDPSNPPVSGAQETHDPDIVDPSNPNIVDWWVNPNIVDPNIVDPNIVGSGLVNPNIVDPNIVDPNIVGRPVADTSIVTPNLVNPDLVNPNIVGLDPQDVHITDVEWTVQNIGNATTTYSLKTLSKKAPPDGVYVQLLVYRVHYTPAVAGAELSSAQGVNGCILKQEPHHELILNLVNPNIVDPNIVDPNIVSPNIVGASIENATFSVPPGEQVIVDLRVLDTSLAQAGGTGTVEAMAGPSGMAAQVAANPKVAANTKEFINALGFAVTSQAVNTDKAQAGIQVPPVAATTLVIGTSSLPDGVVGNFYSATLMAYGGTGAYSWSLNSGELPPPLTLDSNTGVIQGTPDAVGATPKTFSFIVRVDDSEGHYDTQRFSITINPTSTPPGLTITTTPLPDGIQGRWYGQALQATGGVWPRTWSLTRGALPQGLSLDSAGLISGTPTAVGTSGFTVRVTDATGQTATQGLSITIGIYGGDITMSGTVRDDSGFPLNGVLLRGLPNTPVTGDDGTYSTTVPKGWEGTAIPFKVGYFFSPESRTYSKDQTQTSLIGQDYASTNWLVREEWVARYNGPAQASYDYPMGMAMDSQGNAYVTGSADNGRDRDDITTVKFPASGFDPVVANYKGPRYMDEGTAIAIDSADNIYVTGWSYGTTYPAFAMDAVTIRYDTSMRQIWAVRYDSETSDVYPMAIGVDGSGNVYVTGQNSGEGPNAAVDFITLKYNSSGVLQTGWPQTYHIDGRYLTPKGVSVDSGGNVYVTGTSQPPGSLTSTIVTIKYNSAGAQQWVKTFAGSGQGNDFPVGIVAQPSGVYVAGGTDSIGTYSDYLLIKYNSAGDVVWLRTYSSTPTSSDNAQAMAVRPNGDIYITGNSYGDYWSVVTVGYNAAGDKVWDKEDQYLDAPMKIAVDAAGDVCVTGLTWDGRFEEIQTAEYAPDGTLLWTMHDDAGRWGDDSPVGVAITPSGDVVVGGTSEGASTSTDYYGAQYHATDSGPQVQWRKTYSGSANNDAFKTMAIDPDGNVYATGSTFGLGTFNDYTTVKYDATGQPAWPSVVARYDKSGYEDNAYALVTAAIGGLRYVFVTGRSLADTGSSFVNEMATLKYDGASGAQLAEARHSGQCSGSSQAMTADSAGNVYVVGARSGKFLLVKYNASLVQQWDQNWSPASNGGNMAQAVTLDPQGNICVTGYVNVSGANDDIATVKYDPNGNLIWAEPPVYDGPDHLGDYPMAIKTDAQGNVYVLGRSQGKTTGNDFVTIKYSPDGSQLWAVRYNGPASDAELPYGLAVDGSGNVYVTGSSIGDRSFEDYVTIRYDTNGNQLWVARFDSNYSENDAAQAIALDSSGNVYVTGRSQGMSGHSDYATVKYDSAGQMIWNIRYNGPGDSSNYALAIAVDASGYVYVGGWSEGAGANGLDYAIVKYKQR